MSLLERPKSGWFSSASRWLVWALSDIRDCREGQLIAAPTQRAEALGLALSRMYLDRQGIFANQVVVPLDSHLELYREPRKVAVDLQEEVSLKRTDLALFDLNASTRTITCNLIEVKCYSTAGNLAQYAQLKDSIVEQLETSEKVIRLHYDPRLHLQDRIDRAFKTAELAKLLEFYIDRSARFGLLREDAADEARFLIRTLEDGYELQFTRSALVAKNLRHRAIAAFCGNALRPSPTTKPGQPSVKPSVKT